MLKLLLPDLSPLIFDSVSGIWQTRVLGIFSLLVFAFKAQLPLTLSGRWEFLCGI